LVSKIQDAITANPNKKELYYYDGLTYSQISDAFATKAKATKNNPTEKARLRQLRADNDAKAADALKKAVAIDPGYYDATLTLGYVLLNPGLDEYNAANQLPTNQQKEFEAGMAKAKADLEIAKPYLLKAVDLNPKSVDALTNLKAYYLVEQDMVNANKIQKQIEALGGN
jgi:Tfp pilus assembly protein PilF